MALSPQNKGLRVRSGEVDDDRPLVAFLYQLLRDHLPAGDVEQILQNHVFLDSGEVESQYCNGFLAQYARDIADRLLEDRTHTEVLTPDKFLKAQTVLQAMYPRIAVAIGPMLRRRLGGLGFDSRGVHCHWDSSTHSIGIDDDGGAWRGSRRVLIPGKASIPDIEGLVFQEALGAFQDSLRKKVQGEPPQEGAPDVAHFHFDTRNLPKPDLKAHIPGPSERGAFTPGRAL